VVPGHNLYRCRNCLRSVCGTPINCVHSTATHWFHKLSEDIFVYALSFIYDSFLPMTRRTIKAVIFDHDGTLVNSEPVHWHCWTEVLRPFGLKLSQEEYKHNLSGIPSAVSASWLVDKFNLDVNPGALLTAKQKHLRTFLTNHAYPLMPGVLRVLDYLADKRILMAVASGADRTEVQRTLEFHDFAEHFAAVATQNDVTHNKPAPDVYLHAAQQMGVQPYECVAIEDSDNGEKSARAANIFCLRLHPEAPAIRDTAVTRFPDFDGIHNWFTQAL
jgi:HAD superfamily hydrolase (TIGR01509 family)